MAWCQEHPMYWLRVQTLRPPYRAIGYGYAYCIYVFQTSKGIALYPLQTVPVQQGCLMIAAYMVAHRGVSQVNASLCR